MPGTIIEHFESGKAVSGQEATRELRYIVTDESSETAVVTLAASTAPVSLAGFGTGRILRRKTISVTPLGGNVWDVVVPYEGVDADEDESQRSFETAGGTFHMTQSLATVGVYPEVEVPFAPPPDFKGAIGVNGDNVDGVDVTIPLFNFTETKRVPAAAMTRAYQFTLCNLTGCVNSDAFKGFAAGEVLFLGASGSQKGVDEWEVAFKFAASPNATDLPVGDFTVDAKKGWEYLWVRYEDAADDDAKALVKRPVAAYVEQVYRIADFADLEIGEA
jgi:hypothetical protein